jgi:hypothetical protein
MAKLGLVVVNGREILVETEPADFPDYASSALPRGAEFTSMGDRLKDAGRIIEDTVAGLASAAFDALQQVSPDECSVEIALSFKGESSPVPVLVKLGGEASIKVTATWKKPAKPGT